MSARHFKKYAGSALVIVLAFIVLLSIVLLSYLASTQLSLRKSSSSAAIVQTDILAEAALAAVVDDIRQEMLAGSDGLPGSNQAMTNSQPWAMVPGRVLSTNISRTDSNFLNLTKQSLRATPFYPGDNIATFTAKDSAGVTGRERASAVSTAQASLNGRVISTNRWNKVMLLGGSGFTATNQLPDWIFISRRGPLTNGALTGAYTNKSTSNEEYVIGRFAYNIYDVGGLLDVNVAGFPTGNSDASRKGSMAWADLSAIPGVTDAMGLVKWRNTNSLSSYLTMIQGNSATNSGKSPWGEAGGFRRSFVGTNGLPDNRFFTRQDFLRFVSTYANAGIASNALPYLTTFSADLDQASFLPGANRALVQRGSASGGNDAFQRDNEVNPYFLSVTNSAGPVAKNRFPLERLKYVIADPPQNAAEILKYFGLRWSTTDKCWHYVDQDQGGLPDSTQVKLLSEVAQVTPPREPNFVELLQASIAAGSLGGQYQLTSETSDSGSANSASSKVAGRIYGSVAAHVMQIAANIIDQYDADSYPTQIRFAGYDFFGVEDLPYLYAIRGTAYQRETVSTNDLAGIPPLTNAPMPIRCVYMFQPTIWNPHTALTNTATLPNEFRVAAEGDVTLESKSGSDWWSRSDQKPGGPQRHVYPSPSNPNGNPLDKNTPFSFNTNNNYLTFKVASSAPGNFREPYTITSENYPTGSDAKGYVVEDINDPLFNQEAGEDKNHAIGFRAGYMWAGPVVKTATSTNSYFENGLTLKSADGSGINYYLQYRDASGSWVTYDTMEAVPYFDNIYQNNQGSAGRRPRWWSRFDPRTDRFGYRYFLAALTNSAAGWPQGRSLRPGTATGLAGQGDAEGTAAFFNWVATGNTDSWGLIEQNTSAQAIRYMDPDGALRWAMGGAGATSGSDNTGLPMATNAQSSRPVVLNRPFRSVAELGYASRGMPWKQIDFWTPESGDAALLDAFSLYESSDTNSTNQRVVSGRVNLNTRRPEVLQAILQGVLKSEGGSTLSTNEALSVATNLVAWTTSAQSSTKGPLRNRSELIGKVVQGTNYSGFSATFPASWTSQDRPISFRRESVMRALADSGTTRTWTFLIDLIVQTGKYPQNVSGLEKFMVEGEQHYWIHIAIDRYTGEVIAKLVEAVNE